MTLRCPNCGGKELIFLSTTDGFAVGSTDQRYKCKQCGYQGSFVLDDYESSDKVLEDLRGVEETLSDKKEFKADIIVSISAGILVTVFIFSPFVFYPFLISFSSSKNIDPTVVHILYITFHIISIVLVSYVVYKKWESRRK